MLTGKFAIPTEDANGLTGKRSEHFGHCGFFTLIDIENGEITEVATIVNEPHQAGGCQSVVQLLKNKEVNTVIATGMGNGPYKKLENTNIRVLFADQGDFPDVQSVINGLHGQSIKPFTLKHLCKGSGNCHQHTHEHKHQHGQQ